MFYFRVAMQHKCGGWDPYHCIFGVDELITSDLSCFNMSFLGSEVLSLR